MIDIHIDLETYSPVDLKKHGVYRYSLKAEIQIFGWAFESKDINQFCPDLEPPLTGNEFDSWTKNREVRFWAHNAEFEFTILNGPAGKKIGFPKTEISQWRCTMALAQSLALPGGLDKLGEVINLPPPLRKIKGGLALINRFAKPRKPTSKDPRTRILPQEDPEKFQEYKEYNKRDIIAERAIHRKLKSFELSDHQQRVWQETVLMNRRGIPIDITTVNRCQQLVERHLEETNQKAKRICGINLTQTAKLLEWCNNETGAFSPELPDLQEKTLKDYLLKDTSCSSNFYDIINLRLEHSSAAVKKLKKAQDMVMEDQTLKGCYTYHGAHSGRWTANSWQPQNLSKPKLKIKNWNSAIRTLHNCSYEMLKIWFGNPLDLIASCIRPMIKAPEGYKIIVSDYSAIEFRINCWNAGEEEALELFRAGEKPYRRMAARIYDVPEEEIVDGGIEMALGKQATLGYGYQMGGRKFRITCEGYGIDVPENLEFTSCKAFRNLYSKIRQSWYDTDTVVREVILEGVDDRPVQVNRVQVYLSKGFLFIELPSNRRLAYPYPRIGPRKKVTWVDDDGYEQEFYTEPIQYVGKIEQTVNWGYKDIYGGKFIENICQGIAADIMMQGFINLIDSKSYYPFALSHDEAISLTETGDANQWQYDKSLCQMPDWADGLPLEASGFVTDRYRKG